MAGETASAGRPRFFKRWFAFGVSESQQPTTLIHRLFSDSRLLFLADILAFFAFSGLTGLKCANRLHPTGTKGART